MPVGRALKRGANLRKITFVALPIVIGTAAQKLYLRVKNSVLRLLVAIFLLVTAVSCFDEGDCLITNSHVIKVSVKPFVKNALDTLHFDSVYIPGYKTPVFKDTTLSQVNLPVDAGLIQMTYVFKYQGKTDTVAFAYDNFVIVPSPTCGALTYHRNLLVTKSTFGQDSVVITERSLLKDVKQNAVIYF
jgi:hypothetical protein